MPEKPILKVYWSSRIKPLLWVPTALYSQAMFMVFFKLREGSFKSPVEALPLIQGGGTDLLFLDIQMPGITCMDFLKAFHKKNTLVVITSAYREYAIEGYRFDVIDYLLKPFAFERFFLAVQKAGDRLQTSLGNLVNPKGSVFHEANKHIAVKADHKINRVALKDIIFIEGLREYITFHKPEANFFRIFAKAGRNAFFRGIPASV